MLANNCILFLGCVFFAIAKPANSWECLMLGKIAMGVYSGVSMSLQVRGCISLILHDLSGFSLSPNRSLSTSTGWYM